MTLTNNQRRAIDALPATAAEIRDHMGYQSTSGVYDLFKRAQRRDPSLSIESDSGGVWRVVWAREDGTETVPVTDGGTASRRMTTGEKAAKTKRINDLLTRTERELQRLLDRYDPARCDLPEREGNLDMVMFRTDDHFGERESGLQDNTEVVETFNSEMARERVFQHLWETMRWADELRSLGYEFDSITLLMNGDHITGEDIFPGQAHHLDKRFRGQMKIASETYVDVIRVLAEAFPAVRVIAQHGNHGELRTGNQSGQQNADDLLFDRLDLAIRMSEMDNVEFQVHGPPGFTEFGLRCHRGQMRHGQDGLGHIGTSSAKKRWLAWLTESGDRHQDSGWDVAYWGHFHELKWEPIAGRPVLMGGTLAPAGAFVDSLGIAAGRPGAWSHTVSDTEAVEQLKPIYFQ